MTVSDLREEIDIEMELIEAVVQELASLRHDVGDREPTLREKTAAAAFLAQFYGGVENILKRICRFYSLPLPTGDSSHSDLFRRFCRPPLDPLPLLFDDTLERRMAPYRKFRHLVFHSYGAQVDWDRMQDGISGIEGIFRGFRRNIEAFLSSLGK